MAKKHMPMMADVFKVTPEMEADMEKRERRYELNNTREGNFSRNENLGLGKQRDRLDDDIPTKRHRGILTEA